MPAILFVDVEGISRFPVADAAMCIGFHHPFAVASSSAVSIERRRGHPDGRIPVISPSFDRS
jgi:hypothetical protein